MGTLAQQAKWIVEQAKEQAEAGNLNEWLTSLSGREKDHIYFHLLPRSKGFEPNPEKWVQDVVDALKEERG